MKVLFLGAHCDDIELGCGATISKQVGWESHCAVFSYKPVTAHWGVDVDFGNVRRTCKKALDCLGAKSVSVFDFPDTFFYESRQGIWEALRNLEESIKPDLVFTHFPDSHQDHCTLYEETCRNFTSVSVNLYRPHSCSSTAYSANVFSVVGKDDVFKKIAALKLYEMFTERPFFREDRIRSDMVHFGSQVHKDFAEGFVLGRSLL